MTSFPLPPNLPKPIDDGACRHLPGKHLPLVILPSTAGRMVNMGALTAARTVIFCYPTGVPGKALPEGWDSIPGARGCTPQACGFRDHYRQFRELGADVFGLSTQTTEYQKEMAERLHLPFEVLSDSEFKLCNALTLPTFIVDSMRLIKRLTLVVEHDLINAVFYPVFPPNEDAEQVINWLKRTLR